jgi:hypothetical protein
VVAYTPRLFVVYGVAFCSEIGEGPRHEDMIVLNWHPSFAEICLLLLLIELTVAVEQRTCVYSVKEGTVTSARPPSLSGSRCVKVASHDGGVRMYECVDLVKGTVAPLYGVCVRSRRVHAHQVDRPDRRDTDLTDDKPVGIEWHRDLAERESPGVDPGPPVPVKLTGEPGGQARNPPALPPLEEGRCLREGRCEGRSKPSRWSGVVVYPSSKSRCAYLHFRRCLTRKR